jgi:carbonic anhydrase
MLPGGLGDVAQRPRPKVSVSGHVYDIATGRVTTAVDARYP